MVMNLDQSIQETVDTFSGGICGECEKRDCPHLVSMREEMKTRLLALFEEHSKESLLDYVDRVLESDTDLAKAGKSRNLRARYFNLMNHLIHWDKSTEEIEEMKRKQLAKEE